MDNVKSLNFMQPYNVVPQNEMKPGSPAMVDINHSNRADPQDVQIFMNVADKKGGKAEHIPLKYDVLKQALKEHSGRADVFSLAQYMSKTYINDVNVMGFSLGMGNLPAAGCVFSLYDNDSKICLRLGKY